MKKIFTVIIIIFYSLIAEASDLKTAQEILREVELKYQSLSSYADTGYVNSKPELHKFKTYYAEPNFFKFFCSSKLLTEPPHETFFLIWSDGKNPYSLYSYKGEIEQEKSLNSAIAGATGVSLGAAHNVSAILNLTRGLKKTRISEPVLIGEKVIEKDLCYLIKGKYRNSETTFDIYISKSTLMIRKLVRHTKNDSIEAVYTDVSINPDLSATEFDLKQKVKKLIGE